MEIRNVQPSDVEAVNQLLSANGWAHRVADDTAFRTLIANSQRTAVAVLDAEVIGFARALCDDLSNGYLSMVVVAREHRRQGIGRRLVAHIIGDDPRITWVLRAGRPAEAPFFAKLGFVPSTVAMERTRVVA